MKVKYTGPALDYSGYGEANRHDIAALDKAGVQLTTQIPHYTLEISDYGKLGELALKHENKDIGYKIKIIHTTPNVYKQFMEPGKYHIGRIFWETSKLPEDFAKNAELMDEIWTGSEYNAEAIRRAGVTKPIHIIPEAIDPEVPEALDVYEQPDIPDTVKFKFYSIFEWTERKNPAALLKAYWQEFEGQTDVALVIKTYVDNFTPDRKAEIDQAIRMIKKSLTLTHYAPVYLYRGLMDRYQIYRFHKSFDCFVSAHRGEGWGIPQMEALLMGKPVISTNCGGIHEHLINNIHAKLLPYQLVPLSENSRNKQWYTADQDWAEVDVKALREALRWAYSNPDEAKAMGMQGKNAVETLFSLEAVGEKMRERLSEISNEPYQDPIIKPQIQDDGIRVGAIIKPAEVVEEKDENGKVHSKYTIPPLVKKNRIEFDPFAHVDPAERNKKA